MTILTVDFETYYDRARYSLKKQTTESYVNDERFEIIGVAVKKDDGETKWYSGTNNDIAAALCNYDWANSMCLAHNTKFDGAILKWKFGIQPSCWLDTLSMGQALLGSFTSTSLDYMSRYFKIGTKGNASQMFSGMRREDFNAADIKEYADYCKLDVDLTYYLFLKICSYFEPDEIRLIDLTLNMFINPVLEIDVAYYKKALTEAVKQKGKLLLKARTTKEVLMSNNKLAALLSEYGIKPLESYAKDDPDFIALLEHDNEMVRNIAAARIEIKSTQEEKRLERFIDIGSRNTYLPIPLKYHGAITGRWAGTDKTNLQNLPRKKPALKIGLKAPNEHLIIDADSSQIEARILAWFCGQLDVVEQFKHNEDVYKIMASKIYQRPVKDITKEERQVGKKAVLGCGYGMGYKRFKDMLMQDDGIEISYDEADAIIKKYRKSNKHIQETWRQCDHLLDSLVRYDKPINIGRPGVVDTFVSGIELPNRMRINYVDLQLERHSNQYYYKGKSQGKQCLITIYGGKVIENITQALAKIIISYQMLNISQRYKIASTVHDSIVCVVPAAEEKAAVDFIRENMTMVPDWAEGLPLNCEVSIGKNYGELNLAA